MTDLRFALFALALALPAQAQNVQSFEPAPGVHSYFSVEGARTTRHKALVPSVWLNYGRNPLVQRDEDGNLAKEYVGHQFGADLMLSYGIAERLEVALAVPFGVQLGDGIEAAGDDGFAFGDIRLLPRYRFIGEPDDAMGVLLSVPLSFPSGNEGAFYGSEGFVIHPKVVIEYRGGGVGIAANVGYRFRTAEDKTANIEVGDSMSYGAGLLVELGSPQLAAVADIFGSSAVGEKTDDSVTSPLEGLLGLRAFMENGLVPSLGGGVGINPDIGTPEYRVVLGVAWVPPQEVETAAPKDTDLDGLVDPEDQCPEEPEDKDGFQDEDGCPDPDNDRDGIADAIDKCPLEPETRNGVTDE
ncbi:MAG: transporter, partial [Proteobacteria bacterium]|nr:transporter [Pseudomonadota bacterium]